MSIVWDCTTELFHILKHFDFFYPKCECFCIKSRPQMTVPSVKADVWSIIRVFPCSEWTLKAFTNWNQSPFRRMRISCREKATFLLFESSATSPNFVLRKTASSNRAEQMPCRWLTSSFFVSRHQTTFDKRGANDRNNAPKDTRWQSTFDHLG